MTTKRMLVVSALLAVATALFAQNQPQFSLRIRPNRHTFGAGENQLVLEVTTTNLTNHRLDFMTYGMLYIWDVRRDGVSILQSKPSNPETIMVDPKGLPAQRSVTGDVYPYGIDMSQPGKYTIQLQKGNVKSNVITINVVPKPS